MTGRGVRASPSLRGAQRRSNPGFTAVKEKVWIASLRSQ
jgi:hypothetical protein